MDDPTTVEEQNLISAVVADPDSDTHRLTYSRWLKEHGQWPRGRFIEVQCLIDQLHEEEQYLLDRHGMEWGHRLRDLGADRWVYHRGFPEEVWMPASHLLATHEALRAVTPLCRLHLGAIHDDTLEWLAELPLLAQLRSLEIGLAGNSPSPVQPGLRGLIALARSPHLVGLRQFAVHSHDVGAEGALVIARSPSFAHLTHLTIDDPILGDSHRGVAVGDAVISAPGMAGLQELRLGKNVIGPRSLRRLRESLRIGQSEGVSQQL